MEEIPHAWLLGQAQRVKNGVAEYTEYVEKFQKYTDYLKATWPKLIDIELFYGDRSGDFGPELGLVHKFVEEVEEFKKQKDECTDTLNSERIKAMLRNGVLGETQQLLAQINEKFDAGWKLKRLVSYQNKYKSFGKYLSNTKTLYNPAFFKNFCQKIFQRRNISQL